MSEDFVETGQTFTDDGAAYCPVERRRRSALGIAASMLVLVGGAGFLAFAMMQTPVSDAPAPVEIAAIDPPAPIDLDAPPPETPPQPVIAAHAAPERPEPAAAPLPEDRDALIAAALAESRAARAAAVPKEYVFSAPRLKTALGRQTEADASGAREPGGDAGERGLLPRLKPRREARADLDAPIERPTPIHATPSDPAPAEPKVRSAAADDPAYYFLPARTDDHVRAGPPSLLYASDLRQDLVETSVTVERGETFVDALKRAGVTARDRNAAAYAFGQHYNLRRLRPGQTFALKLGWPNQTIFQAAMQESAPVLLALDFRNGYEADISVTRTADGAYVSETAPVPLTSELHAVEGRIEGSLYLSAKTLGAPDEIIAGLADAFAYDVDFQREIRGGDEFEVIFEAQYDDRGQMAPGAQILFARLNWRGKSREKGYYRFSPDGDPRHADYFDATGQSAKRLLMKTPIDGARLSSGFGTRRHPILGYARAHKGVDFAAPRGTPVKAAGDGVVERANRYGSFGNYIRIRHANGYKTAYAHLNGFARGIRAGKSVRQGDIIGYVGTTGRSTGPHLHYEVHLNDVAVNPQKLKIATGRQLKGAELERFRMTRDRIDLMRRPPAEAEPLYAESAAAAGRL